MSQAVAYNGFLFLAGQVADDTTADVPGQTPFGIRPAGLSGVGCRYTQTASIQPFRKGSV